MAVIINPFGFFTRNHRLFVFFFNEKSSAWSALDWYTDDFLTIIGAKCDILEGYHPGVFGILFLVSPGYRDTANFDP
jgi:hypothetical protein